MSRTPQPHRPDAHAASDGSVPDGRREPTAGPMEGVEFRDRHARRASRRAAPAGRWWPWPLALLLVALTAAVLMRQPLADRIWPETRAQALREQAAAALARQHLTAADGSGARELYEAALAIEPDRTEARAGLMRVAQAALAQARAELAAGRFEQAHRSLRLAQDLSVPRAQAEVVAAELRRREAAHAGLDDVLASAHAARAAARLVGGADAALPLYKRVLALQPQRIEALEGREDALGELLQQAGADLDRGEVAKAAQAIATARGFDPGHADLPDMQARLGRALELARQRADADLRSGRLVRAAEGYRQLIDAGAGNAEDAADRAPAGGALERVGLAYAARAERAASDFKFDDAEAALREARTLAPNAPAVREAGQHLQRARQSQARLQPVLPGRERNRRVARLLEEAAAAEARGDLLAPPGDSAYDKLRAARALAPTSVPVRRAAARLVPTAQACFEQELRGNNLARARACLDVLDVLGAADTARAQARRRLALRWLAVGEERLGAGEVASAAAAVESARSLDRATPGLAAFGERVRAASAGTP